MSNTLTKRINTDLQDFTTEEIVIADKYTFNQKSAVKDFLRAYNSQFKEGKEDDDNSRKFFKNIVKNPCAITTKAISFFPSDINITSRPGQNKRKAWLFDRDLKRWISEVGFDEHLRETFEKLPIYGSVVWKKVGDKFHFVDLRNFACEQSADSLRGANYVIEQHLMTPAQVRKMDWKNKEDVLRKHRTTGEPYIRILEWRGELPKSEIDDGDEGEYARAVAIVYVPLTQSGGKEQGMPDNAVDGITLLVEEEKEDDFPYREFHLEKIPGRWLGVGKVEQNIDAQIRTNEITNLRAKSSYFASLNLWQTRDNTVETNLLHDVSNGDIIPVLSEITRIPNEDRNVGPLGDEETGWLSNRDEVSHSYDVIRGERLPSGTPLGAAELAAQMTMSYFDGLRRKIASQLKPIIKEDIIQDFFSQNSNEHYLRLIGEDFDKWADIMIAHKTGMKFTQFVLEKGHQPTKTQWDMTKAAIADKIRKGKEAAARIPKEFYKNLDYEVDIIITGQNRDVTTEAANVQMVLQAIQQDEELLTNPRKRRVFSHLLDTLGLNISDFEMEESTGEEMSPEGMAEQKVRGGGISGGAAGPTGLGRGGLQTQPQAGPANMV